MTFRKAWMLPLIVMFCLLGCSSPMDPINKEITNSVSDNKLDSTEFFKIKQFFQKLDSSKKAQFETNSNSLDNEKISNYIVDRLSKEKPNISSSDIWSPQPLQNSKFNIHVFVENSLSMDGYVQGTTNFKTSVYSLLGRFKSSPFCQNLHLNYINSRTINFDNTPLEDFIEKLDPASFELKGGQRGESDMSDIIKTITSKVDADSMSILVSDFVFSPGKSADNAQAFLDNQEIGIYTTIDAAAKKNELALVVLSLESEFDGNYYDMWDSPIYHNQKRPFYIWMIGTSNQIKSILNSNILEQIKNNPDIEKLICLSNKGLKNSGNNLSTKHKILLNPKVGSFSADKLPEQCIIDAESSLDPNNKGEFSFSIAVDFRSTYMEDSYIRDPANYRLSDSTFHIQIQPVSSQNDPTLTQAGFTHVLNLSTKKLSNQLLNIDLIYQTPKWVKDRSSSNDSAFKSDSDEQKRTFGFQYLIDGVCTGLYDTGSKNNTKNLLNIPIKIVKKKTSFTWVFFVFALIIIALLIYVFRKKNK